MRFLPLLSTLLVCTGLTAQLPVKITDATVLDHTQPVRKSRNVGQAMAAAALNDEQKELVLKYGDDTNWPAGIKDEAARARNKAYIQNFTCYRIGTFPEDSTAMALIMIPAKENIHMPEEMRPLSDLYLVVPEKGLTEVNTGMRRPEISRGPRWKNAAPARILKPEDLYATYDIGSDSTAIAAMQRKGMSPPEIDAVIFRSTDRNWPDGIDTFDERQNLLSKFTKYKAFVGAKWDDKILLIIPAEKNRKMPVLMRPYVDLYFVYNASSVEVKEKKRK